MHALGVLRQIELHALDLLQQGPGVLQQCLAGRGWRNAAAAAFEQGDAQRRFECTNPRAGRGQRQVAALGAGGDVAALYGVDEQAQVDQVEVHGAGKPLSVPKAGSV
ncbi:hypothetical protein D3C86_1348500 [compost metagenome]